MKLPPGKGEFKYAVAVRESAHLRLVLWVRRSPRGEFFIMKPMGDGHWDMHTSYHLNGTLHMKSYDRKATRQKRQALTGTFRGTEDLGIDSGYVKGVGAVYHPVAFSGVVEVPSGVLGPMHGAVGVALVEPGHAPPDYKSYEIGIRRIFQDVTPNVVITVLCQKPLNA